MVRVRLDGQTCDALAIALMTVDRLESGGCIDAWMQGAFDRLETDTAEHWFELSLTDEQAALLSQIVHDGVFAEQARRVRP